MGTKEEIFLIISDLNMPGLNGMEFKKKIDSDNEKFPKVLAPLRFPNF